MSWTGGNRHVKHFRSKSDGKVAFKQLWVRAYGGKLPNLAIATKYTGNDKPQAWLATVTKVYNS